MGGRSGSGLRNSDTKFSKEKYIHINPNFNPDASNLDKAGFNNNCVKCAIAFEANMRGNDVEAKPFEFGVQGEADRSKNVNQAFNLSKSETWDVGASSRSQVVKEIELQMKEDYGSGSRAIIQIESGSIRHTMNVINEGGTVKIIDAQSGKQGSVAEMLKGLPTKNVMMFRTDDKKINSDYSSWAYRKRKEKS